MKKGIPYVFYVVNPARTAFNSFEGELNNFVCSSAGMLRIFGSSTNVCA